ncbi:mucoidy inhibitor MuiA family protein [Leptospira langatensis]|uniref:Mucoidy inhibitor MuiA family protein n=1 Tax=Leptospira langatensis TaxID=2484983 RepID=A0A5F1ZUS3_9LEPT|nr:mucoidy inhibitor MuiA family protein [Leptospira langatensis]TGK01534.1 mucoidy inhibitor MuiA family protein [Leptospira langatensis]TGL42016.1 mucoidy inhibitor MuiA family protein [Leptospira langatensis]
MKYSINLMNSKNSILAFLILFVAIPAFGKDATLPIKEVTVHQGTAQILRTGKVQLEPGANKIEISNLPVSLLEETLTASTSSPQVEVTGSRTWKEEGTAASNPEVAQLQKKVQGMEKELEAILAKENDLKAEKELLEELRTKVSEAVSRNLFYGRVEEDGKQWGSYLKKTREEAVSLFAAWEKIEKAKQRLQTDLEEARAQLSILLSQAEKSTRITWVQIVNTSSENKTVDLRLSYLVSNADWRPAYILTAEDSLSKARLEYIAEIRQETGEDWRGVQLLLSTTRPDLSLRRNRLRPQRLFDVEIRSKQEVLVNQSQAVGAAQVADEESNLPSSNEGGSSSERGSGFLFRLPKAISLASQRESRKFEMLAFTAPIKVRTIAAPRYKPFPLLEADMQNTGDFPILPGEVSLFRSSGLVGRTKIGYVSPKDTLTVSLGTEGSLRLSYRKETNQTREGIISSQKVLERRVYLNLENFGKETKTVIIRDQIPVSEVASVKVEINPDSTTPGSKEYRTNSGIYEWNLEIPPSGKKEIRLEYKVTCPSEFDLNFLQ